MFLEEKRHNVVENIQYLNALFQSSPGVENSDIPHAFTEESTAKLATLITERSMRIIATNNVLKVAHNRHGEAAVFLRCEMSPNKSAQNSFALAEDLNLHVVLHFEDSSSAPVRLIHFKLGKSERPVCHLDVDVSTLPLGEFSRNALARLYDYLMEAGAPQEQELCSAVA